MGTFGPSAKEQEEQLFVEQWRRVAKDVVDDLELVLREPALPLQPPPSWPAFPKLDVRWYEQQSKALEALGFRRLGDVDGTPLTAKNAWPTIVRVFLSADGRSSAALFQVLPKAPGVVTWLLLKLMGKWPAAQRVTEFMSYGPGGVLCTSTAETPFLPPPGSTRSAFPAGHSLEEQWAAHQRALAAFGEVATVSALEELGALRERQRLRQRAWRDEVGLLDAELDALVAPHGKNGKAVRPHVVDELKRRARASRS